MILNAFECNECCQAIEGFWTSDPSTVSQLQAKNLHMTSTVSRSTASHPRESFQAAGLEIPPGQTAYAVYVTLFSNNSVSVGIA